ncbi:MAG: adenylosuccinate lyase [Candidatus Magasanikbacteria bacterium]|nr:adenylosuccinate lyase [Candidatus Magasanikbacteria bacterium]
MSSDTSRFRHPLTTRYTSDAMQALFSEDKKFMTWHDIWIVIAQIQQALGIPITDGQIGEMVAARGHINYPLAARLEKEKKHDVVAHAGAFGADCPNAQAIIHYGATSCEVTDNADLIIMREALDLICVSIAKVINRLSRFAVQYSSLPTLGYTHFQAAQLTTVGKRACMWLQDLVMDLAELERLRAGLRFRGAKGTTGTQASFLEIFDGNHKKVEELESRFAAAFGFNHIFAITGQTYTRKQDSVVFHALASLGATIHKMATDLRLLAHEKEIEEPFDKDQVGSSAMAYKRNPMRCERACGLAELLMKYGGVGVHIHADQWMERTLDDSAIRRIAIAEAFLLADAILMIMQNVCEGLVVYPKVIARNIREELPFMATENFIVAMVKKGGDRGKVHERIRVHSQAAARRVKEEGLDNNLIDLIRVDSYFSPIHDELDELMNPITFIGRAAEQVDQFLETQVNPALKPYHQCLGGAAQLNV